MAGSQPEPRCDLECVVIGDEACLWGGISLDGKKLFPRDLIHVHSISSRTWRQRLASGDVPLPCYRARCEVIRDTVFTYGGKREDGSRSMDMYRLDTTNLSWSEQAIDPTSEIPHGRSSCCFVALNLENLLLFGGYGPNPGAEIQAGASWIQEPQYDFGFNNELYVFNLRSKFSFVADMMSISVLIKYRFQVGKC